MNYNIKAPITSPAIVGGGPISKEAYQVKMQELMNDATGGTLLIMQKIKNINDETERNIKELETGVTKSIKAMEENVRSELERCEETLAKVNEILDELNANEQSQGGYYQQPLYYSNPLLR